MAHKRVLPLFILAFGFSLGLIIILAPDAIAQGINLNPGCTGLDCQFCHLMTLADKIVKYLILVAVPIAALLFSYAGYLYMSSEGSDEKISKAKSIFKDVIIGFVLAALGFTIVDTVIQTLANGTFSGASWKTIQCQARNINGTGLVFPTTPGGTPDPTNPGEPPPVNPVVLSGDCATGNIPQPTGSAWNSAAASTMACLAQVESTCNPGAQVQSTVSNATGLYQVIIGGYNDPGHNLNFPSCSAAAGVSGDLNCYQRWVDGGRQLHSPQLAICEQAAKNAQCNTDAANALRQAACGSGGPNSASCYTPWTSGPGHAAQQACVAQYNP